ncbi:MAG: protein kinase [Anaerolineae bacterium]|nr:protein kinase [Anaerolineae bacterium]
MNDPLIGRQLGNYQIISALGRGGMARVYKARDLALNRLAAIKIIEPALTDQGVYSDRFRREARAIAALEHPHIVPVYYFAEQDGLYFLAMKFIEGENLTTLMERYAIQGEYLPPDDIVRIVEAVGSALDYAHSRGVIHRDVKPSNVMVDLDGHPYLTDFGLALDVTQGTLGEVFGTSHYIAPEQARSSANVVPQSDLYSLGVMLFELFTGVVPFDDITPTAIALQHILNEPPLPRTLNPALPPSIETVILKAMIKNPSDRYQTGKTLTQALRTALDQANGIDDTVQPTLPPLPPGVKLPSPRQPSLQSVATKVQESLVERSAFMIKLGGQPDSQPESLSTPPAYPVAATTASRSGRRWPTWAPWLVVGLLAVAALLIIGMSLLVGRSTSQLPGLAQLPTLTAAPAVTATAVAPATEVPLAALSPTPGPADTLVPTPVPAMPTAFPTVSPLPSLEPAVSPSMTLLPSATVEVQGPTPAPADWLPVRFIYGPDAFYWLNDSTRSLSSQFIVFQQVDGSKHFEGNRWAYWTMEAGRCMEIAFADVGAPPRPAGCRPNAFFTPTRSQGVDFWIGTGQFRVLWNNQEVARCEIAAGQCTAFIPPA